MTRSDLLAHVSVALLAVFCERALASAPLAPSTARGAPAAHGASTGTFFTAKIHDLKNRDTVLFENRSLFQVKDGKKIYTNTITDMKGAVAAVETTTFQLEPDGKETLLSYEQDQRQQGRVGRIEIVESGGGDSVRFSLTNKDGAVKSATEKRPENLAVGPSMMAYLRAHWSELSKGETVKVRFAVMDRQETVGFDFRKIEEKDVRGTPAIVVKMKPSSFIIAALVDPLVFTIRKSDLMLMELEGRTVLVTERNGKLKELDGYTTYDYPL